MFPSLVSCVAFNFLLRYNFWVADVYLNFNHQQFV